jgi:hypothetical protein
MDGIEPIDGGYRIGETETHIIDVMRMLYNWRITTTPKHSPLTYDGGWCYVGTDPGTFLKAVVAAKIMIETGADQPCGWNKNVMTGEWREDGQAPPPDGGIDHGHPGQDVEAQGSGGRPGR